MRDKFFQRMYTYKYSIYYLEIYLDKTVKTIRNWKIFIAVASSVAIACWTQWANLAYYWGLIVAIAQVASVVLELLPFEDRKTELSKAISAKTSIYQEMEYKWDELELSEANDEKYLDALHLFDKKWVKSEEQVFKSNSLPQNQLYREAAEKEANRYFANYYGVKE